MQYLRKAVIGVVIIRWVHACRRVHGPHDADEFPAGRRLRLRDVARATSAGASLERTDQVLKKVENDSGAYRRRAVLHGHRRLQFVESNFGELPGILLHELQAVGRTHVTRASGASDLAKINGELATQIPEAMAFAFMPPSIPGLGSAVVSRCGCRIAVADRLSFSIRILQAFLAAARKRPELAGVMSQFSADVPQIYADVDRDKALKQGVKSPTFTKRCRRISVVCI